MTEVRKASQSDCYFISRIILMAESTGFEITSYEKMFEKSQEELQPVFEKIVNNPTKGHPLTFDSYLIATVNGEPAAAISVYTEGEAGDSNHLMTGALMSGFDRPTISKGFTFLKANSEISIPKKRGTVQIDCVATLPEHRGKGLLKELIRSAEEKAATANVHELQIQVWKKNSNAIAAYQKIGFRIEEERLSKTQTDNGKVLMTKNI